MSFDPGPNDDDQGSTGPQNPKPGDTGSGDPSQGAVNPPLAGENPAFGVPGAPNAAPSPPGAAHPGQDHPGPSDSGYPGQGDPNQGYPGQGYPNQGYPDQGQPGQGYPGQGYPNQGYPDQGVAGNDAALAHYLNLVGVLGPLIYWLAMKDRSPVANREGKTALNWALTLLIAAVVLSALTWIPFLGLLFSLALGALYIVNAIFAILGGIQASKTGTYVYPFSISFLS